MRFLAFLFIFWVNVAVAADQVPVKITSDNMQYSQKSDEVIFTGNVYVLRLDTELWSNTLTVVLDKKNGGAKTPQDSMTDQQGSVKKIIAKGDVRIKSSKDRSGTCGRAEYDAPSDMLTMEDNPILMEGQNKIQGEVIKIDGPLLDLIARLGFKIGLDAPLYSRLVG